MPDTAAIDIESSAFAVRLGNLLTVTRRARGRSIRAMATATNGLFSAAQLRQLESGSLQLDEPLISAVCQVYGADLGAILPSRQPVSVEDHVITAGGVRVGYSNDDPRSLLTAYLRLIRAMRHQKKAPAIALRRDDIVALARRLKMPGEDVVDRLTSLMGATTAQRTAIASLFATDAIVIGLAVAGAVTVDPESVAQATRVVADTAEPLATAAETSPADGPEADAVADTWWSTEDATSAESALTSPTLAPPPDTTPTGIRAITMPADSAALAPAVRIPLPEVPSESPAPPQVENQSGCKSDVASPAMRVVIPDISYDCPVYAGGQALIDAGFVTLVTDAFTSSALTTRPGGPGTLWLAAHRSTNGGAFADVPSLADGAIVIVADGTDVASYRVVGRAYVEVRDGRVVDASGQTSAEATWESVVRPDRGSNLAPRLLLQTCEGENFRWMIYADLVSG